MRVGMVVNPTAARGRHGNAGQVTAEGIRQAGHLVVDVSAGSYDTALCVARRASQQGDIDALVVVGGDGMVHLGVNAVAGTPVAVGVVPSGTGNDFARALGLPRHAIRDAVQTIIRGLDQEPTRVDVGIVHHGGQSTRFMGVLSAGLDAAINATAQQMSRPHGSSRYILAAFHQISRFVPYGYQVTWWGADHQVGLPGTVNTDGSFTWSGPGTVIAVANNRFLGGGMKIAPQASMTDGYMDLVLVAGLRRLEAGIVFPGIFGGYHTRHRHVSVIRATRVTVSPHPSGVAAPVTYADGEPISALPVDIRCLPRELPVIGASLRRDTP